MRLDEPKMLVEVSRDPREQVLGTCVTELCGLVDGASYLLRGLGEGVRDGLGVGSAGGDVLGVWLQRRALGCDGSGTVSGATEDRRAFGGGVDHLADRVRPFSDVVAHEGSEPLHASLTRAAVAPLVQPDRAAALQVFLEDLLET